MTYLTTRETEILTELEAGSTQDQAARRLGISTTAVQQALFRARRRTGCITQEQLVAWRHKPHRVTRAKCGDQMALFRGE